MAPPSALDKAEADRVAIKDQIEFIETELNRHPALALTYQEVEQYLQELDTSRSLLGPNHSQLRLATPKTADFDPCLQEYRRLYQLANRVFAGLHGIKMGLPRPATPSGSSASGTSSTAACSHHRSIKLPPLELPKFSGNLQEWVSFRDLFTTAVDRSTLTKVEKLTQLKALLTGEAARQVRSLVLSDANYDIAWSALKDRYENNRELLFSILQRLLTQPNMNASSAVGLRSLIDTTKECVRSLEVLTIPTQHWDAILLYLLFSKLDPSSKELWEQSLPDSNIPSLDKLYDFLEQRARALAASNTAPPPRQPNRAQQQQPPSRIHHSTASACKLGCSLAHPLYKCPVFQQQFPEQRQETVKTHRLCRNCLNEGHRANQCTSKFTCKTCREKHHSMLHPNNSTMVGRQVHHFGPPPATTQPSSSSSTQPPAQSHHCNAVPIPSGILATAIVNVHSSSGHTSKRSLVDGGSTHTQIQRVTAKRLKLPLRPTNIPMTGPAEVDCGTARYVTTIKFSPWFNESIVLSATALVVDKISGYIPSQQLKKEDWPHLVGLQLADPNYDQPDEVEILLGTDIAWDIMEMEKISGFAGQPHGIKTTLGWLVAGPNIGVPASSASTHVSTADLDLHLQRFFEQEEPSSTTCHSKEEVECEKHFASTHSRDPAGRFTVKLPFKEPKLELGSSRQMAIRRFLGVEARFNNPRNVRDAEQLRKLQQQWNDYKSFMEEYETLGHMEEVPIGELETKNTYYIPHHCVFKESSTTTKLRVVFDASAATSNGYSLNDILMVGPQLQDTIWEIMLRFRLHPYAFTADIAKMYRQIRMAREDADYHRIIWRADRACTLKEYRLLTVTYGTGPAPYVAVKCLQQLAKDERSRFPLAAVVALRNFYVDDALSSCPTLEEAKETVTQLLNLCMSGGFELRKWTTNSQELLSIIPESMRETNSLVELDKDTTIKTLGIFWNPSSDQYSFRIQLPPDMPGNLTKRIVLSQIAKIYDPLGWLAPAIIVCKLFMQALWKLEHSWDDKLPSHLQQQWSEIRTSLQDIEQIKIPRCVMPTTPTRIILVGCSDASTKAISAAAYLACEYNGQPSSCQLLTSKTRVAPVKLVTLPRLELNGCVLLSELLQSTVKTLQINITEIRCFTDSTIALHWVKSAAVKWKLYIRRRVQSVQENLPTASWFHIPGDRNPADCASRGISGQELLDHPLWWNGVPEFFGNSEGGEDLIQEELLQLEREIQVKCHHIQSNPVPDFLVKFGSFVKLRRVVASLFRFVHNCRNRSNRQIGALQVNEHLTARNFIVLQLQKSSFASELKLLSEKKALPTGHRMLKLKPFVAADGLMRVGGRLKHAQLAYDHRHPILLPRSHHVTNSIIMDCHLRSLHGTATETLAKFQQQFWVTNGYSTVKAVLRKCVTCSRHRAEMMQQIMGDLPPHRINPSRPFSKVGVDYAGPFFIKPMVRSRVTLKCWLSIFVCMATRAIHIEVVSSLSTDCFLAAFRRFIARRGKPNDVYSDCGTNFKGADKALSDFFTSSRQQAVKDECANEQISWHFIPPGAPHFGGLWEAGVKSIKHHLVRVMGSTSLTYEEMHTLVTQIEGILNSRPIIPASSDPSDLEALTPAHFLIGAPITAPPEPDLRNVKENHLQRWQLLQQRQQLFWKRWSLEYLTRLQQRPKWMKVNQELQVDQLVVIKDERLPPLKWKLGRVKAIHPGSDGHVRVATLHTTDGEIKRPVAKLSLLPIN